VRCQYFCSSIGCEIQRGCSDPEECDSGTKIVAGVQKNELEKWKAAASDLANGNFRSKDAVILRKV
jgi:hypothetical protein